MRLLALLVCVLLPFPASLPSLAWSASAPPSAPAAAPYRCPMHPAVTSPTPAKCTICGMNLVALPALNSQPSTLNSSSPSTLSLSPSTVATLGVETSVVARQPLTRTLRITGRIEDDDTRHRILSARVPGRIEKLHINYVGAQVAAGAPLVTLFSPEVLTAQRIYVERLRAGAAAVPAAELSAARERLIELGLAATDIAALEKSLTPTSTVVVRAPVAGTVVAKSVYEGQYVSASDRLLELADFSRMWFVFDAYAQDIPWLHVGQTVEIATRAVPGVTISAPIEFIDPNFSEMSQTARVRAVLPNPHYSSPGGEPHQLPHRVLAEGRVLVESPAVLAAPRSSVLDAGHGPVAYVDTGDRHYQQRQLTLGRRGDALVEILDGLHENERVVTTGALLIDAAAQLAHEATPVAHTHDPASPPPPSPSPSLNSQPSTLNSSSAPLAPLADLAIAAAAALAADDYARYEKLFPDLTVAAKKFPQLPTLDRGNSLTTARQSFEPWSTQVADLLRPHRAHLGLKIYECPMTPVLGKGRWAQRSAPLRNPFFGATMLECGEEVR